MTSRSYFGKMNTILGSIVPLAMFVFEVQEDVDDDLLHHHLPNFKMFLLRFYMSQKETKEKENHPNTISKMIGTLVQVQLYTFSYRKALFRPRKLQKKKIYF